MTLLATGEGEINQRASMLANTIVRGPAILHFGGTKGKSLHTLLRPGKRRSPFIGVFVFNS